MSPSIKILKEIPHSKKSSQGRSWTSQGSLCHCHWRGEKFSKKINLQSDHLNLHWKWPLWRSHQTLLRTNKNEKWRRLWSRRPHHRDFADCGRTGQKGIDWNVWTWQYVLISMIKNSNILDLQWVRISW